MFLSIVSSLIIIGCIFLLLFSIFTLKSENKKKENTENTEIPEDVITPIEALTLDQNQKDHLNIVLKKINFTLKKNIDGYNKTCTIDFEFNDLFPKESLYEIQRLYIKAGWKTRILEGWNHKTWKICFTLPDDVKLPKQITNVRVNVIPENKKEPTLEELGIDTLEQRFKNLEKKGWK